MSKKRRDQFKEKILANKIKSEQKRNEFKEKRFVVVDIEEKNLVVKIDRKEMFVSSEEVEEIVRDIFYTNTTLEENTIIELDRICDVTYKLDYQGIINNEALFSIC